MKNHWSETDAAAVLEAADPAKADQSLALRVYTSRILGQDPDLVLHGGGNTSVKVDREWPDGSIRRTLHVKGSGWDLATIESPGLPAVDLQPILASRANKNLSDPEMVALLRAHLMDADAPNPSVETLLHAFIPHQFVDHTHSLPILILANQPNAEEISNTLFGEDVAFVPYVMPGFDLSIAAADIRDKHPACKGLFLKNHGLFTFSDDAEESYRLTIEFSTKAEEHLKANGADLKPDLPNERLENKTLTNNLRAAFATAFPNQGELFFDHRQDANVQTYTRNPELDMLSRRGTVTPDHVIRTKPFGLICEDDDNESQLAAKLEKYTQDYTAYFDRHAPHAAEPKTMLLPMPTAIIVRGQGIYGVGKTSQAAAIVADLMVQTTRAVVASEKYCRFQPIKEKDLFDMEYWTLEQAKLASN